MMEQKQLTLKEASMRLWKKKFCFSGRISRDEFWLGMVSLLILEMILSHLTYLCVGTVSVLFYPAYLATISKGLLILAGIFGILLVLVGIVGIASITRRLHDIGKSGWWQLILIIPCIGMLIIFFWTLYISDQDNQYGKAPYMQD